MKGYEALSYFNTIGVSKQSTPMCCSQLYKRYLIQYSSQNCIINVQIFVQQLL